jgi:hypothetical protein
MRWHMKKSAHQCAQKAMACDRERNMKTFIAINFHANLICFYFSNCMHCAARHFDDIFEMLSLKERVCGNWKGAAINF